MYKRIWRPPPATLDLEAFKILWKKQRLAEIRDAVLRGDWPKLTDSEDSHGQEVASSSTSTSCSTSPQPAARQCTQAKHVSEEQAEPEDEEFEQSLQAAADEHLQAVLARLQEEHSLQLQQTREAAQQIEDEHTATTQKIADIQAQLDDLKREKHELFQQLKLVRNVHC